MYQKTNLHSNECITFTKPVLLETLSILFAKYLPCENTDLEAVMPQEKERCGPCYQIRIEYPNVH